MTLVLNAAPTPSFLGHSGTINPDSKLPLSSFSLGSNHLTTTCCAFSLLFSRAKVTMSLSTASLRGADSQTRAFVPPNASAGKVVTYSTSTSTASASSPAHPYARFTCPEAAAMAASTSRANSRYSAARAAPVKRARYWIPHFEM